MSDGNLELALRIKADLQSAIGQLRSLEKQIESTGTTAQKASGGTRAQSEELGKLLAQIDPTEAALQRLDRLELQLEAHWRSGAASADTYSAALAKINAKRDALTSIESDAEGGAKGMKSLGLNTSFAQLEIARVVKDLSTGQFSLAERSALTLGTRMGLLSAIFSVAGAAIIGVGGGLALVTAGFIAGTQEDEHFNSAIATTNGYIGLTVGQLRQMSQGLLSGRTSSEQASAGLLKVADSGQFTGEAIGKIAKASIDMANTTGQSIDSAVKDFERLAAEPTKAVMELNKQYHFLTDATYEHIRALEQEGRTADAAAIAQDALAEHFAKAAAQQLQNMGYIETKWDAIKFAAHAAWDAMLDVGRSSTIEDKLDDVRSGLQQQAELGNVRYNPKSGINTFEITDRGNQELGDDALKRLQSQIAQYKALSVGVQKEADKATRTAIAQTANDEAIALSQAADQFESAERKRATEIAKAHGEANKAIADAIASGNQQLIPGIKAAEAKLIAGIESRDKKSNAGLHIDHAELSADVAATRDALNALNDAYRNSEQILEAQHKAGLVSDAAYFGGKLKDIDDLETAELAQLEKEKANVATHGKTAADRIRIDQQVASIDAQITKVHADAVAKRAEIDAADQANQARRQTQLNQLTGEFLKATGQPGEAALLELHAKYDAMLARMVTEGDTAGAAIVRGLIDVGQAQVQLQDLDRVVSSALAEQQRALKGIDDQRRAGLLSDGQAQQQIVQEHQTTIAVLQQQIPVLQQLANDYHLPGAVEALQKVKDEIADLSITTNQYLEAFGQGLNSGLGEAIDGLFDRTLSLGGAVKVVLRDIAKQFEQLAINELSQRITASVGSLFHVGGDAAGASATGTAITAASAAAAPVLGAGIETGAATGALTLGGGIETGGVAAGTTIATAMTIAGTEVAAQISIAMAAGSASNSISTGLAAFGGGGFATGGLVTGPGTETSDSILVRLSTGEHVTNAAAVRHYGADMMAAINARRFPRFADGGFVGTISPRLRLSDRGTTQASVQNHMRVYLLQNEDELAQRLAQHPVMEKAIVAVAGDNGEAIRASW